MIDTSAAGLSDSQPVPDLIRTWVPTGHIAHIQFNDRNRRAAGQGDDAFFPILSALKETGYDRVIAMEPFIYEPETAAPVRPIRWVTSKAFGRHSHDGANF